MSELDRIRANLRRAARDEQSPAQTIGYDTPSEGAVKIAGHPSMRPMGATR